VRAMAGALGWRKVDQGQMMSEASRDASRLNF
jgi:hypothetical protein